MNLDLRESIVKHIMANLAIIPSTFVNLDKSRSLQSKDFLLSNTISYLNFNNETLHKKVWGCQTSFNKQEVKLLLTDCSLDSQVQEYAMTISFTGQPTYGLYLLFTEQEILNAEALIAVSLNGKDWLECTTYMQATFLTGMEGLKDFGLPFQKSNVQKEEFNSLISFINFHSQLYGDSNEG